MKHLFSYFLLLAFILPANAQITLNINSADIDYAVFDTHSGLDMQTNLFSSYPRIRVKLELCNNSQDTIRLDFSRDFLFGAVMSHMYGHKKVAIKQPFLCYSTYDIFDISVAPQTSYKFELSGSLVSNTPTTPKQLSRLIKTYRRKIPKVLSTLSVSITLMQPENQIVHSAPFNWKKLTAERDPYPNLSVQDRLIMGKY